jgi:Prophage protein (DUF1660)
MRLLCRLFGHRFYVELYESPEDNYCPHHCIRCGISCTMLDAPTP